jgi:hypothetical protein
MSFKLAAPSLLHVSFPFSNSLKLRWYKPLEPGVLLKELIKVRHELIDRLAHVHVSDRRPDIVCVREGRGLVLCDSCCCLELVSVILY